MPLYFFYTMVQKSQKWPKTQIKGSCLNFFTTWTIPMKRGALFQHAHGYKKLPQFFLIFAQGLSYGLSKSKKMGEIITKLWTIIP